MDPPAPAEVRAAAANLRYRDFLTVALVVPQEYGFPDNWIYVHTPGVSVGRIQNFGAWSPYMVKDGRTCLGLEYFVTEGDELWSRSDQELVALATEELRQLKLIPSASIVESGYAVRIHKAYPVYDDAYRANVDVIRAWLDRAVPNVYPVGRNGMHRYNNQDHSMLTAMLTVENILTGTSHDVWKVNVDEDYHEEGPTARGSGRMAPIIPRQARRVVPAARTSTTDGDAGRLEGRTASSSAT
jgi:protoporphyrinogen oxidase